MTTENLDLDKLLVEAEDILRQAGAMAMTHYGKGRPDLKFDEELVTQIELQLTAFFQKEIESRFPGHRVFFSNQEEAPTYSHAQDRFLWVFDALDGAANMLAGIPVWGLSAALLDNHWPTVGLFFMPATGDFFQARAGGPALHNKTPMQISTIEDLNNESLLLTYSRFHHHYHSVFPGKIRNFGCTGAHICYVAMGRADATVIANESFQELAAARVLIEASGGKLFTMSGGEFYLSEHLDGSKLNEPLLVTTEQLCPQVQAILKPADGFKW